MRSATLLAFVDWRPSAVKSTILSGVLWLCHWAAPGAARPRASAGAAPVAYVRASAGCPAGSEAGRSAAAWAAPSGAVSSKAVGGRELARCNCYGRSGRTLFRKAISNDKD